MTNDWNPLKQSAEGEGFFLPKIAGASDDAAGVGARLLLSLSLSRTRSSYRRSIAFMSTQRYS